MNEQKREEAMETALDAYLSHCDHEPSSPTYKGWPMSVCDVCRGRFSEESFEAGYRAGAANVDREAIVRDLENILKGCSDLQCIFHRKAQGTNGGCVCRKRLEVMVSQYKEKGNDQ